MIHFASRQQDLKQYVRALAAKRKLKRVPLNAHPSGLEREYQRDLLALQAKAKEAVDRVLIPRLPAFLAEAQRHRPGQKQDAWGDDLGQTFQEVQVSYAGQVPKELKQTVARQRAMQTGQWNKNQLTKQFQAVLGIEPLMAKPWMDGELSAFVTQNVDLITSISDQYFKQVQQLVWTAMQNGTRAEDLADEISDRYDVSESRAKMIGRDQISKLNGNFTKLRQSGLGVKSYTWTTAGDERVRDSHAAHEGNVYDWDDPPGDTGHPGEDVQCRCIAVPVMESIADDDES